MENAGDKWDLTAELRVQGVADLNGPVLHRMEPFDHLVILIIAVLLVALEKALILVQQLRHALAVGDDVFGNLGSVGVDKIFDLVERGSGGVELVDGFLLLLILAEAGQADEQSQQQDDG